MRIARVAARWLHSDIPFDRQHVSDFGRVASFDTALVEVETDDGTVGWGEAKAAVGSAGSCAALVTLVEQEIGPTIVGRDPRNITALWERMYNGSRDGHSANAGRVMPVLGRRGLNVSAISGVDMALWDVLGRLLEVPVIQLWGGPRQPSLPAYASGGWADAEAIGAQLAAYCEGGFTGVKMRVGVMDGDVATSVERVEAARSGLGADIDLMVDAHGTFAPADAIAFAHAVEPQRIRWFEEPVSADDRRGLARVRASTSVPIAAGESEFTRFDFADLVDRQAVDVLQPDLAICGGPTEGRRIAALAESHQLELAPHCWGSALSFASGVTLAFSSPSARVIEYSLGANPFLHELVDGAPVPVDGVMAVPTSPGFGATPRADALAEFSVPPDRFDGGSS
jgi:L-alanine-DL-glutamate epimerase-like enolase superfamily enzyme